MTDQWKQLVINTSCQSIRPSHQENDRNICLFTVIPSVLPAGEWVGEGTYQVMEDACMLTEQDSEMVLPRFTWISWEPMILARTAVNEWAIEIRLFSSSAHSVFGDEEWEKLFPKGNGF